MAQVDPPLPYGGGARGRPGGPAVGSSRPAGWTSLRAGEGLSPPPKPQDHSGPDISISLRFTALVGTVPPSSQKRSAGGTFPQPRQVRDKARSRLQSSPTPTTAGNGPAAANETCQETTRRKDTPPQPRQTGKGPAAANETSQKTSRREKHPSPTSASS